MGRLDSRPEQGYPSPGDCGGPKCPVCGVGSPPTGPKLYDVHIYALVRVKVVGVGASSQEEAIRKAEGETDLYILFDRASHAPGALPRHVERMDYAEEVSHFLVDEREDRGYDKSLFWRHNKNGGLEVFDSGKD